MQKHRGEKLNIKDWAEEDRPREKLLAKGINTLSNAELLAILIGSGNREESAVELSQRILHFAENNLNVLGKLSVTDYVKNFKGIGEAKAITIIAALELGKRRKQTEAIERPQIQCSKNAFDIIQPVIGDLPHEEVWILLLNPNNRVTKTCQISKGGVDGATADIRMILKEAIEGLASSLVICHNHPSGYSTPSTSDDALTYKLREACSLMDIALLDHLIIADNDYYSYKDANKL